MTPWELQLCANAHGKSMSTLAWMTAGMHRSKKMPSLAELTKPYEPRIDGDVEQDLAEMSLFGKLSRMADAAEAKENVEIVSKQK